MTKLEQVGPDSWREFIDSPLAVLMLSKSDCAACAAWTEELQTWLEANGDDVSARFGKLLLDQRGLIDFKKANPWLADVDVLPFNVIYQNGEKVKDFAGGGIDRLTNRLERLAS